MSGLGPEFTARVSEWLSDPGKLDTGYALELRSFIELPEDSALWLSIERGTFLDMWDDLAAEFRSLERRTQFRLVDPTSRVAVHPADVGVGVSQVVPVVVAALDPDRPRLTAIEQPELHIHPKVQVGLGDLFASQIGDGTRRFLLETHSEHLMLRLLRRIEETHSGDLPAGAPALPPDQVAVVFIEQIEGEVRATQLRIDESGEFVDRWPQGFFEERAKELF
jgi:predicted ATPase